MKALVQDLNPAGAVTAPVVCSSEDLWLFTNEDNYTRLISALSGVAETSNKEILKTLHAIGSVWCTKWTENRKKRDENNKKPKIKDIFIIPEGQFVLQPAVPHNHLTNKRKKS